MPEWDLDVYFPGLDSPEFESALARLAEGIAKGDAMLAELNVGSLEAFLRHLSDLTEALRLLDSYAYGKLTTDTRNALAQAKTSELDNIGVPFRKLLTRFNAWVGTQDIEDALTNEYLRDHGYMLRRAKIKAEHLMSPAEEALAAELNVTGGNAWSKLHGNVSSQMEVTFELNGETKTMPMSAVRTLAYDSDRGTRQVAYEAELLAWKTVEVPLAAAMNSIKGEVNTLTKRRNWASGLDEAVFDNEIDRGTLDAMMSAAREAFPDFRRYLKAKAKAHGLPQCEWYDIFAPVEGDETSWSVDEACDFVAKQFDRFSSKMGGFARRSYDENWTDFAPKPGKVDGAYCMYTRDDESRILMNFKPSFGSVKTLAHELGHAYHAVCMAIRAPLLRETPSTLAETASIFCETIVKNAALEHASGQEKVALLDACLQGPCQTVMDISSRFQFENGVFEGRLARELSPAELCELMLQAQKDTYGDGLASYHPYMWAAKPHYYSQGSFYNFPYMFGLLFSLGLYKKFDEDPDSFRARYDDLLSSTGMADAAELGKRFGFDTRDIGFWRGSFDVLRRDVDEFVSLV